LALQSPRLRTGTKRDGLLPGMLVWEIKAILECKEDLNRRRGKKGTKSRATTTNGEDRILFKRVTTNGTGD